MFKNDCRAYNILNEKYDEMIVEHTISLTKNIAKTVGNNQHITFSSIVAFCTFKLHK